MQCQPHKPQKSLPATDYARLRRLLREHRQEMRIMDDLIVENNLELELVVCTIAKTGKPGFYLGIDEDMDIDSEEEDPQAKLLKEVEALRSAERERQSFITAASQVSDFRKILLDLERARMSAEDLRR